MASYNDNKKGRSGIRLHVIDTVNTTRLPCNPASTISVYASRMLWPSRRSPGKPKVIILAPDSIFPFAYMAASLVHDPVQGNVMLIPLDELPEETAREIKRIDPEGIFNLPPVVLIGPFEEEVVEGIRALGYDTCMIFADTVFGTAAEVARLRKRITPDSPDGPVSLFVISASQPCEGMPVPYYAAHAGVPILFTHSDRLPATTAEVLQEFQDNVVYIVGGLRSVDDHVKAQISGIVKPLVRRIAGRNAFATAVEFAAYYDPETQLGWNRNRKGRGDAFTFSNAEMWELGAAATGFAHQGKHTPLLLTECDELPDSVRDYLDFLRPPYRTPPMPPFMHSFILGSEAAISYRVQAKIDAHTQMELEE